NNYIFSRGLSHTPEVNSSRDNFSFSFFDLSRLTIIFFQEGCLTPQRLIPHETISLEKIKVLSRKVVQHTPEVNSSLGQPSDFFGGVL
ncbi:MAG: hypothetical protein AABY10_00630, partial [Nanoarchaeota archaeon]